LKKINNNRFYIKQQSEEDNMALGYRFV